VTARETTPRSTIGCAWHACCGAACPTDCSQPTSSVLTMSTGGNADVSLRADAADPATRSDGVGAGYGICDHASRLRRGMPSGCRIAQHVATPPYGLDVVLAASGLSELLAHPGTKTSMILRARARSSVINVIEEHLLGQDPALVQAQQLEDAIFLAGQVPSTSTVRALRVGLASR
jgi:hypothetical protein